MSHRAPRTNEQRTDSLERLVSNEKANTVLSLSCKWFYSLGLLVVNREEEKRPAGSFASLLSGSCNNLIPNKGTRSPWEILGRFLMPSKRKYFKKHGLGELITRVKVRGREPVDARSAGYK